MGDVGLARAYEPILSKMMAERRSLMGAPVLRDIRYLHQVAAAQQAFASSDVIQTAVGRQARYLDHQARLIQESFGSRDQRLRLPFRNKDDFVQSNFFKRLVADLEFAAEHDDLDVEIEHAPVRDDDSDPRSPHLSRNDIVILIVASIAAAAITAATRADPEIADVIEDFRDAQLWLLTILLTVIVTRGHDR